MLLTGRGWGKLLALDTAIPTPQGWKPLALIETGDTVFDEHGSQCQVTGVYDNWPERAWRLQFSDGTSIVCGDEHLWLTYDHYERKAIGRRVGDGSGRYGRLPIAAPRVRSTGEIVSSLKYGKRGDANHSIPVCSPLVTERADLAVDPYILGLWLGDGSTNGAAITTADESVLIPIREAGYNVVLRKNIHVRTPTYGIPGGFLLQLRALGVLGNKHIPTQYLRASEDQRLSLLQGLMDSDGYAGPSNVEFCSTNHGLAGGVIELARSLGQKPRLCCGMATLNGRVISEKFRVHWRPTIHVFKLKRKRDAVAPLGNQAERNNHRMIVAATEVPIQPMRCLEVNSKSHLFLASRAMIPTHNTSTAAEETAYRAYSTPKQRIAVVGPTFSDARDTCVEGEHGLLHCIPPALIQDWNRSIGELVLTNDSRIKLFTADKPGRLRGPQHHFAWCDEIAQFRYLDKPTENPWDNLMLGLRLGQNAQCIVTSTPKPLKKLKQILADPGTVITRGSTYENLDNLAPSFREFVLQYEGTSMARQELYGDLLDEMPGALWTRELIERSRVQTAPEFRAVVIAVDPSTTDGDGADEAGLIAAGVANINGQDHCYPFADSSGVMKPHRWGNIARQMFEQHQATSIIAEANQGGQMVRDTINFGGRRYPVVLIHAKAGKQARAEPVQMRYAQGLVHHVGALPLLENQMCTWNPSDGSGSPDRLDALVYAVTHLIIRKFEGQIVDPPSIGGPRIGAFG